VSGGGQNRRGHRCAAVEFKKIRGAYRGSVQLRDLSQLRGDPADTLRAVAGIYRESLGEIKRWQKEARALKERAPLPARKAWQLGDILHRLQSRMAAHGCKLQSVYDHLERHAGLQPRRAAEFIAFRKHIDDETVIPRDLTWSRMVKQVKSSSAAMRCARDGVER